MTLKFKIKISRSQTLLIITLLIAIYYLVCGIYLNNLGYFNQETF